MASVVLQEKINFTRLIFLLIDKGTEAFRKALHTIHPPASLAAVLNANKISLEALKYKVINTTQWDLLYPPSSNPPDSETFDVTLLTILLRNICNLRAPATGWDVMPPDTDRSLEANIARIKSLRNTVYAHVTSTRIDDASFETLWQKIAQALVEMNIPQNDIDDLKTASLSHEEEIYAKTPKDWKSQDEELLQRLVDGLIRLQGKVRRKLSSFLPGTRDWLLKEVDDWFTKENPESRIFLLTAGPGFGKSVFAAKVCEDFKKKEKLAACHFCDFNDANLRDPMTMLQSLASQMCQNVPGFEDKLHDQLMRPNIIRNLKEAFRIYLQNPLDELKQQNSILIVIDALDESSSDNKNEIINLLETYFPDLPICIKVLITSRPEIPVERLQGFNTTCINIDNYHAENNSDLQVYLKNYLSTRVTNDNSFEELVNKCEGSFLFAFYVQTELLKQDDLDSLTINKINTFLPKGLYSVYQKYFKRLEDELEKVEGEKVNVLKILELLVASHVSLPLPFVYRALGLTRDCRETKCFIEKINETVSCLLYVSDHLVTVFHKSVIDWLLAKGYEDHEYVVKVANGKKLLWQLCEKVFEEYKRYTIRSRNDFHVTNEMTYALKHGLDYLVESNMKESYFWAVDVVIVHAVLKIRSLFSCFLDSLRKILRSHPEVKSSRLRAQIAWHYLEINYLKQYIKFQEIRSLGVLLQQRAYLQSVIVNSPTGCFSVKETKIAELILSKFPRLIELKCKADYMPKALWLNRFANIAAVDVSFDKTLAAFIDHTKVIYVLRLPELVELCRYSTEYHSDYPCCTLSPDNSFILFGKLEIVFDIAKIKEVPFFSGNKETFWSCAFSPNGKRLVTGKSSIIKLWEVDTQILLSSFIIEDFNVIRCSFSRSGLFIFVNGSKRSSQLCVWNAITLERCDVRFLSEVKLKRQKKVLRSKKCDRCFQPRLKELTEAHAMFGTYSGMECTFVSSAPTYCKVVENTHFITLAEWFFTFMESNIDVNVFVRIGNNLYLHGTDEYLLVYSTLPLSEEQISRLQQPTCVLWSSFSPDDSRLATCTSDGYINIWNVETNQVEDRFRSNQGGSESSFACLWSNHFLFVFDLVDGKPMLGRYPVSVSPVKVLFTEGRKVSLCNLMIDQESLSIDDFSEGLLRFNKTEFLDVNNIEQLERFTLPEVRFCMNIAVAPGASFIIGVELCSYFIWNRNTPKLEFHSFPHHTRDYSYRYSVSLPFGNDSKVALFYVDDSSSSIDIFRIDLDTGNCISNFKLIEFLPKKKIFVGHGRVVIALDETALYFIDTNSGNVVNVSVSPVLSKYLLEHAKLSPNETVLSFPSENGDMKFLRLCIPEDFVN